MNSLNRDGDWEKRIGAKNFGNGYFLYIDGEEVDGEFAGDFEKNVIEFIRTLIEEAKAEERKRCLEALPKKREPLEYYLKSRMQEHIGFNQALTVAEESIKKLDQISQSIKERE